MPSSYAPSISTTPGIYDEFFHALAARTRVDDALAIPGFTYRRAELFTQLVALAGGGTGTSLVPARWPSVISGGLLCVAAFGVGRAAAGPLAGRAAALLLCFDPQAIYLSQVSRFYMLHAVVVLVAVALVYDALGPGRSRPRSLLALVGAAAGFALAYRLSLTTVVALCALAGWIVVDRGRTWLELARTNRGRLALLAGTVLLGTLAWWRFDLVPMFLGQFQRTPTFLDWGSHEYAYYVAILVKRLPVLTVLLPVAFIAGRRVAPRFVVMSAVVLGLGLALHSAAASKQTRYAFWCLPFLYLLLGTGFAAVWPRLRASFEQRFGTTTGSRRRAAAKLAACGTVAAAVVANPSFWTSAGMLTTPTHRWPGPYPAHEPSDWAAAAPTLARSSDGACALVASSGLKALYYLGRLDYELLLTVRNEQASRSEFAVDSRTRAAVISEPGSIGRVVSAHPSGLVIIDAVHWRHASFVPDTTADTIERSLERVDVPADWRLVVFRWGAPNDRANCPPPLRDAGQGSST